MIENWEVTDSGKRVREITDKNGQVQQIELRVEKEDDNGVYTR